MHAEIRSGTPGGRLGFASCVMLLVGAMIGSAIFSLSGMTMYAAGPAAAISWLLAGAVMLMQGLGMAELSCRFPHSGGVYVFPRAAFGGRTGRLLGWMSCWGSIVTNVIAVAFSAIYVGQYLGVSFPWANGLQIPLALLSILLCLGLNAMSISLAGKFNAILVLALLGTLLAYISAAFFGGAYDATQLRPFFSQGNGGMTGFLGAIPIAIIGYSGIVTLAFIVSEIRDANRTVPRAMATAIGIVIAVYLLVIFATMGLVTAKYLDENPGMRFIPIFCACARRLPECRWLQPMVSVSAVLALLTTMLACITVNAHAIRAASEDGTIPAFLARRSRYGTPALASLLFCLATMLCSCFPQFTMQMVNFGALFNTITITITMVAFLKARQPNASSYDGFRAPGHTAIYCLVLVALLACNAGGILAGGSKLCLFTLIVMGAGMLLLLRSPTHDTPFAPKR